MNRVRVQDYLAPNLVPMIDIMFLLLLFFMLGSDMTQRDLESVRLPRADQARKDPPNAADARLTINACHLEGVRCDSYDLSRVCRNAAHWQLRFRGEDCTRPGALAAAMARIMGPEPGAPAERKVMIRADAAAPYGLAQRALAACAENRLYRIEVGAAQSRTP